MTTHETKIVTFDDCNDYLRPHCKCGKKATEYTIMSGRVQWLCEDCFRLKKMVDEVEATNNAGVAQR